VPARCTEEEIAIQTRPAGHVKKNAIGGFMLRREFLSASSIALGIAATAAPGFASNAPVKMAKSILDCGAVPGGKVLNTKAIQRAIDEVFQLFAQVSGAASSDIGLLSNSLIKGQKPVIYTNGATEEATRID
jgi:hypothetical protein